MSFHALISFLILWFSIFVLYRLFLKRQELLKLEGFLLTTKESQMDTIVSKYSYNAVIEPTKNFLPFNETFIKAAYDAANTGSYLNADMIPFLLRRGCRYLDFRVQLIPNDKNVPDYYVSNNGKIDDSLQLITVLTALQKEPIDDPIIVKLRIIGNDTINQSILSGSINDILAKRIYNSAFTPNTNLNACKGKIVVLVENNQRMFHWRNKLLIPLDKIHTDSYSEMSSMLKPNRAFTPKAVNIVEPDGTYDNMIVRTVVSYKYQISPFQFYNKDDALDAYENLFNHFQSAFVSLKNTETYTNSLEKEEDGGLL